MADAPARSLLAAALTCAALAAQVPSATAQAAPPPAAKPDEWDALLNDLRGLPDRMLAKLPEDRRKDPQLRREAERLALQALTSSSIDAIAGDGDFPEFMPSWGPLLNIAQPNSDTIYRMAQITPGGTYRIAGKRGSAELAVVSQAVRGKGASWPELDLAKVKIDAHGRYEVILGPARPVGHSGDWWQLDPSVSQLMLRFISSDWAHHAAPTISIERIDRPMRRERPSSTQLAAKMAEIAKRTEDFATMFLDRAGKLRAEGFVNRFKLSVPTGALERQSNYEGVFEIEDDEALIVETPLPANCQYRSILLINELYQTIDWYNNQSSLNGEQSNPDFDGKLRFIVSARDP